MIGIVLVTHGNLAREFLAALEHVVGPQQCISAVCIGAEDDIGHVASGLVLHSLAYAGLTLLLFSGTQGTPTRRALQSLATIALMGALDEVVQSFLPYRNGAVSDWLVDCSASAAAALLLWAFWPRMERAWQRRPA